ncbi:(2,3-dihydroxybenzoyl)adenylate synthase [Nocardia sp. NPDC050175]|uniref:(2,3-dihydroxybenzoyl)adenylate synthase n=1 Tax=Nocardia sp. NPDC050175 TaxID=3364317 RepID=UPI00378A4C77
MVMLPGAVPWPEEFAARYRRLGYWTNQTLGELLGCAAAEYGARTALVAGPRRWSYAELDHRATSLAAGFLRLGIENRDRVVVQLPNVPEFVAVCFALFRIGAVPVLALPAHRRSEIMQWCDATGAVAYIVPDRWARYDYRPLATEVGARCRTVRHTIVAGNRGQHIALNSLYAEPVALPSVDAADVALLQISGGSTGMPKLIPRTHDDYGYSVRASAEVCGLTVDSTYLAVLPCAHNFPLSSPGILGALHAGAKVVLAENGSADEVFPLIEREQVTTVAVVPPLALLWMEAARLGRPGLRSLRVLQVGGARISAAAARRVEPVLGCSLQQVFGMAEGLVNYTRPDDPPDTVTNSQGRPLSPADEILVVDDDDIEVAAGARGHLLTRGPYTIRGYYDAPEHNSRAFTPDGFYRTGDIVRVSDTGHLVVEGRAKDVINKGGEKVAAEEVENHLLEHPAVRDAALVSVPDEALGERVCAFVVAGADPPRLGEVRMFLAERGLAAFKLPDRIEIVDAFPKTRIGKVDKKMLRAAAAERVSAHVTTRNMECEQ